MKKILSFITIALLALTCTACNQNSESSKVNSTTEQTTIEDTTEEVSDVEETTIAENTTSALSEDDLIKKIASDFSTDDVKFTYSKSGDDFYMLDCNNDNIDVDVSISKVGDEITPDYIDVIFNTNGTDDICYRTLVRMLKSDVFDLSTSEQMDILVDYKNGGITFDNGNVSISETEKENIRVISFSF